MNNGRCNVVPCASPRHTRIEVTIEVIAGDLPWQQVVGLDVCEYHERWFRLMDEATSATRNWTFRPGRV